MTSTQILAVIAVLAVAVIVVGVVLQWGVPIGLIVGGSLTLVGVGALLYDPDSKSA